MTIALTILAGMTTLLAIVMFGAMIELYSQIHQIRTALDIADTPLAVDVRHGSPLANVPRMDQAQFTDSGRAVVLLLSDSCSTCKTIAETMPMKHTPDLKAVLTAKTEQSAQNWLNKIPYDQISVDLEAETAQYLNVGVAPVAVRFQDGLAVDALTVPSRFVVDQLFNWIQGVQEINIKPQDAMV